MVELSCKECEKILNSRSALKKHMIDKHKQNLNHKNLRTLKKNKIMAQTSMKVIGVNAAGLSHKLASFDHLLESVNFAMFFVEETKMKQMRKI